MRLKEILREGEADVNPMVNDLTSLLSVLKNKGEKTVDTSYIVRVLQSYGHNIDEESIMSFATQSPLVKSATSDTIEIEDNTGQDASGGGNDAERDKEIVSQMAQDTAMGEIQK